MNLVPVTDWFYLHNATPTQPHRLSRVAFWRVEADDATSVRVAGILNESADGKALLVQADPEGGVYLQAEDIPRGHLHLLYAMKERITPPPPAIPPPGTPVAKRPFAGAPPTHARDVAGNVTQLHRPHPHE